MAKDKTLAASSSKEFSIEGMEKVVATVTGYTGLERFNLIKLIDLAGGNYVGRMSKSITHLVCWKYEGTKYELAKKFKTTVVVNHRWVEDCIKEGRCLSEDPYTLHCGQQVGPLAMTVPTVTDVVRHPCMQTDQNENLFPELKQSRHGSKRKVSKGRPRQKCSSSGAHHSDEPYSPGIQREELELLRSPLRPILSNHEGRAAAPETSSKSRKRRIVKKNMRKETLEIISDSEQEIPRQADSQKRYCSEAISISTAEEECRLSAKGACESISHQSGQKSMEALTHVEHIDSENDVPGIGDDSLNVFDASSDHIRDADANNKDVEQPTRLHPTTGLSLSCVICWTEFSASRGLLPCGHRFCFSCIQSWADHMTSSGKTSTCPLCKTSFDFIRKVDDAVSSDQKIYSQTVPHDDARMNIYFLDGGARPSIPSSSSGEPMCCSSCGGREPEDLLQCCDLCQVQRIHAFCLDPPIFPWTCASCKDLRRLYLLRRY